MEVTMGTEVVDDTTADVTDKTGDGASADGKPADDSAASKDADAKPQDSSGSGKTQEQITDLLDKYQLGSAEELDEFIGNLSSLKEKLGTEDIEELLANKKALAKIKADWQRAEESKRRETETPEQTIERLEREINKRDQERQLDEQAKLQAAEDRKAINNFNSYVSKSVDGLEGLTKPEAKFVKKYLGVNNPIHDIELTDSKGITKLIHTAAKDYQALKDSIIEDYEKNGRRTVESDKTGGKLPPMSRGVEPGSDTGEVQPKNLRDAREIAKKQLLDALSPGRR
jgi:hypothetical protein